MTGCWVACLVLSAALSQLSLQETINANPGRPVEVPVGEVHIEQAIRISTPGSGLYGQGTIIQDNPEANIVEVYATSNVRIEGITVRRADGKEESFRHAIHVKDSERVELRNLRVVDNRSTAGTVFFENCQSSSLRDSAVVNYKRIGIDDRTASDLYGYAFNVIDGTGILVTGSRGISIQNNHVVERNIYPTKEIKEQYSLGQLTEGQNPTKKGGLAPPGDYANNWHQGSAVVVTSPEATSHVFIEGNLIENAAQGIDIHADSVTCSNNIIDHAFVGTKSQQEVGCS
jgi:ribosomal protein L24